MRERFVEIKTAGGVMEAFVTHPEDNRPFSAVIIYMDIWGVREELYDIARRVGAVGYYCMVPDFYYRQGKRIHFEFRNEKNQTISINRLDRQALREIQARPKLSNKMVIDDTGAILEFLRGAEHVRRGHIPGTLRRFGVVARDDSHFRPRRLAAPVGRQTARRILLRFCRARLARAAPNGAGTGEALEALPGAVSIHPPSRRGARLRATRL